MKSFITLFSSVFILSGYSHGQQVTQITQHMFFKSVLNPGAIGSEKYLDAGIWNRNQWTGFEGAPRSQYLSVNSSFFKSRSGVGGYIFNDEVGPIRNTGLSAGYSYKLPVNNKIDLSFGLAMMLSNFRVDGTKIDLHDENDQVIDLTSVSSTFVPEASTGLYLFHSDFYAGLSAINIINSNTPVFISTAKPGAMPRVLHINFIGGYEIKLDKLIALIPSIYISKALNNPLQTDVNLRIDYSKKFQFGVTYRTKDAMAFLLGIHFLNDFILGYSYDLQFSELKEQNNGSHEISLRYAFYYNSIYKKMSYKK